MKQVHPLQYLYRITHNYRRWLCSAHIRHEVLMATTILTMFSVGILIGDTSTDVSRLSLLSDVIATSLTFVIGVNILITTWDRNWLYTVSVSCIMAAVSINTLNVFHSLIGKILTDIAIVSIMLLLYTIAHEHYADKGK